MAAVCTMPFFNLNTKYFRMVLFALSFPFKIQGCWYRFVFIKKQSTVDCQLTTVQLSLLFSLQAIKITLLKMQIRLSRKNHSQLLFSLDITISFSFNIVCFNCSKRNSTLSLSSKRIIWFCFLNHVFLLVLSFVLLVVLFFAFHFCFDLISAQTTSLCLHLLLHL